MGIFLLSPGFPGCESKVGAVRISPVVRVVYLFAVAVGVFVLPEIWQVAVVAGIQAILWLVVGLGLPLLVRRVGKLGGIALLLVLSFALTGDLADGTWVKVGWGPWAIPVSLTGLYVGALMLLRILAVILASGVVRAGDPRAIASGLRGLAVPASVAISIDTVLALLGDEGGRPGSGQGGGRRRHRQAEVDWPTTFWEGLRRLSRGDVDPIAEGLDQQLRRAQRHLDCQELDSKLQAQAHDLAVVAGLTLTMLGIRAVKVLPAIPFAPGHKLVVLTPLYVVASQKTHSRFGGSQVGLSMGVVSFLMGDGKYGVFEIIKHVVPGALCDLLLPVLAPKGTVRGGLFWSFFGALVAAGRFAAIFAMILLVQAPALAWAILLPGLAVHMTFGALSGYVTGHLLQAMSKLKPEAKMETP